MAVYVMKTDPWYTGILESAAKEGVRGLLQGMLDRSQQAAEKNRFNKEFVQMQNAMSPTQDYSMTVQGGSPETSNLSSVFYEGMGVPQSSGMQIQGSRTQTPSGALGGLSSHLQGITAAGNPSNTISFRTGGGTPTRADAYKALGTYMSPQYVDEALKIMDAQYGNGFKLQDADQVMSRVGETPQYNDRQGLLNYMNRIATYNPTQAATMGNLVRTLNPQQNYSVMDMGNRRQVISQDPWSGNVKNVLSERIGVSPDSLEATRRANIIYGGNRSGGGSGNGSGSMTSAQYRALENVSNFIAELSQDQRQNIKNHPELWNSYATAFGVSPDVIGRVINLPVVAKTGLQVIGKDYATGDDVYKNTLTAVDLLSGLNTGASQEVQNAAKSP